MRDDRPRAVVLVIFVAGVFALLVVAVLKLFPAITAAIVQ